MAFLDTLKKVAISAKCKAGWHAGEWKHIPGKPECHLEKICPDCGKHVTTEKHKYGKWEYVRPDKCDSVRACIYCGSKQMKVIQLYQNLVGKDLNCRVIEKCIRCGYERTTAREKHTWYYPGGKNVRECVDCHKIEEITRRPM